MSAWVYIVFIGYLVGVLALGYWTSRSQNVKEFFAAGQRMPYWVVGSAYVATFVSAASLLGVVGATHQTGMLGNAAYVGTVVGYIVALALFGPLLRRFGQFTIPDYLGDRYDSDAVRMLSAVIIFVGYFLYIATQVIGVGILFRLLFGLPYSVGLIVALLIVMLYTMLGGMLATAYVDVLQMLFMWTSTIIIAAIGFGRVGGVFSGLPNLVGQLKESSPEYLTTAASEGGVWAMWSLVLIWLFGTLSRADTISRAYLAKNEREVYKAVLFATPMIMASGIMFFFIGILGAGLLPNLDGLEAESTFLIMAQDWAPGIITGLAFAGLLATAQSTISGQLMVSSMAVSRDIYARVLLPRLRGNAVAPDERHILSVARYSMVFMGLIAAALAVVRPTFIIQIITLAVAIMGPGFLVTFLAGFFWRRATKTGAIIALVLGVTSATYLSFYPITVPGAPWLVAPLMSIVITGVGMVVGSLVSQPPSEGAIEVYERLRRRSPATSAASGSTESNARELERD